MLSLPFGVSERLSLFPHTDGRTAIPNSKFEIPNVKTKTKNQKLKTKN